MNLSLRWRNTALTVPYEPDVCPALAGIGGDALSCFHIDDVPHYVRATAVDAHGGPEAYLRSVLDARPPPQMSLEFR